MNRQGIFEVIEEFHTADSDIKQESASYVESNDLLWSNSSEFADKMNFKIIFHYFYRP